MVYFSCTHPGVVKAWHMHKRMTLNYAIISGQLKIVLYDSRKKSPTKGLLQEIYMSTENYFLLSVPPLIWNGFKGIGIKTSIIANCSSLKPGKGIGMSTIAGTMMVLYASVLSPLVPGVVGHLLAASVINIVGAVYLSKMLMPGVRSLDAAAPSTMALQYESLMDAIARGTQDGLNLALQIGAMLLVLNALVALVNSLIGYINPFDAALSLELIMGWVFAPVAFAIGIPWAEAVDAGGILGTKLVLNEFIGYLLT